ncbi:Na+/panthothenate symporter [Mycobacteroides abscessus subsp. abscessus]|nr:Na+/panthothenate symporter [Mycobacteroides abscessus subsp. abscessus]
MITGVVSYILFYTYYPNAFGMNTVIMPIILSFAAYMLISMLTAGTKKTARPGHPVHPLASDRSPRRGSLSLNPS